MFLYIGRYVNDDYDDGQSSNESTDNNLQIPLCKHYEIRKDSKFVKNSVFSKMKLTSLLMKKRDSFPSKICPVF